MRKQMTICGEHFDILPAEGGGYTAVLKRDQMFFFTGKDHADLRRRMPAEMEAWQAEKLKAREFMQTGVSAPRGLRVNSNFSQRAIVTGNGGGGNGVGSGQAVVYDGAGRAYRVNPQNGHWNRAADLDNDDAAYNPAKEWAAHKGNAAPSDDAAYAALSPDMGTAGDISEQAAYMALRDREAEKAERVRKQWFEALNRTVTKREVRNIFTGLDPAE